MIALENTVKFVVSSPGERPIAVTRFEDGKIVVDGKWIADDLKLVEAMKGFLQAVGGHLQ